MRLLLPSPEAPMALPPTALMAAYGHYADAEFDVLTHFA